MLLEKNRIICFGDSITAGKSMPEGGRWTSILQESLSEAGEVSWDVYNRGVPGETIAQGLDRFEKDVEPLLPAVTLIEFGLNDASFHAGREIPRTGLAEFRETLKETARKILHHGGTPVAVVNHRVDPDRIDPVSGRQTSRDLAPYQQAIRDLASGERLVLVDVEAGFGQQQSLLAPDGIHLSAEGHVVYARLVFNAVLPLLESLRSDL